MHHLSIDLETYSSVPLAKAGAQKYIQSPDFEILLFAFSVDGAPVQIIDLARGERLPPWLVQAITSPEYIKHAYNAPFEWGCLSKYMGTLPPDQWRCTMFHGLYCGYTAGLDATGKALGLPQDKQKLNTGKALIRYFCVPCKPSKANGQRSRNLPQHDPAKWELFKEYCKQDVVTEMEIEKRLSAFPVPDWVQKQWETDLIINARGVAVDLELVTGALSLGDTVRQTLMAEAMQLSGLSNPNSVAQLTTWLQEEIGEELADLRKDTVARLLGRDDNSPQVSRMLEIRQELGKTSTKKYDAIEAAVCEDGRVRGLLQFYGANRTGRWAGRLVQVQNLPRTYTEPLDLARELVKGRKLDALRLIYGSVPDTLSQLIRTAFVAPEGHVLIDADFSAIEARVISWLAKEQWRLEVFRTHGKIYEASASQMFGVPLELIKKGRPEYALRQKGKVAELALGYQGSTGALITMGALDMGLTEEELPDIVSRWRPTSASVTCGIPWTMPPSRSSPRAAVPASMACCWPVSTTMTTAPTASPSGSPPGASSTISAPALARTNGGGPPSPTWACTRNQSAGNASKPTAASWWRTACRPLPVTAWPSPLTDWRPPGSPWCSMCMMRWSLMWPPGTRRTPCSPPSAPSWGSRCPGPRTCPSKPPGGWATTSQRIKSKEARTMHMVNDKGEAVYYNLVRKNNKDYWLVQGIGSTVVYGRDRERRKSRHFTQEQQAERYLARHGFRAD